MASDVLYDLTLDKNKIIVSGIINFATVMEIYQESLSYLKHVDAMTIDFAKVTASNSAGIALLIEWLKYSRDHKIKLKMMNLTDELLAIAEIGGIDDFFK